MAELQGPAFFKFFSAVEKAARTECATFWAEGFWDTSFWQDGFWEDCSVVEQARYKTRQHSRYYDQALREDEEVIMLIQSFIKIISCH